MPVIRNKTYKKSGLYSLRVKGGLEYREHAAKPFLRYADGITVVLNCYSKVQFESSKTRGRGEVTKNETYFKEENLSFLDYDAIYSELQRYKTEKVRYNVNITRQ